MHQKEAPFFRVIDIVPWLLVVYVVYRVSYRIKAQREFAQFARDNGCAPAFRAPERLFWGLERLYRIMTFAKRGEDLLDDVVTGRFDQYGNTIESRGLFNRILVETREPAIAQAALSNLKDWEVGELRHKQFRPLLGKSIFTTDGAQWEHYRSQFRPHFSKANVNDLEETDKAIRAFFSVLPKTGDDGWKAPVDLKPLALNYTLDAATSFFLGQSVNSQLGGKTTNPAYGDSFQEAASMAGDSIQFAQSVDLANQYTITRVRLTVLYFLCDGLEFRRTARFMKKWTSYFVDQALRRDEAEKQGLAEKSGKVRFIDALVQETKNPQEIRDQLLAALGAGRDSTASLISYALYELAFHPKEYARLREHVLTDFPKNAALDVDRLRSCRYLQWVLNETLRIHPPVALNNRVARRNTVLPLGGGPDGKQPLAVQKGTTLLYSNYSIHRRKDLWGEDADLWRPERWETKKPDASFLPFSKGPRICLGQQYALTEAGSIIARFAQKFDQIEPVGLPSKPEKGFGLVMYPKDGVTLRLHEAVET